MHGVVSLLDEAHYRQVEQLWAELEERFGLRGIFTTPFPHISYHVAERYDLERLEPILRRIARQTAPFQAQTTGLGIFTGAQPVLYIPVVRSLELSQFHRRLWRAIDPTSSSSSDYYAPEQWMPHITIGLGDIDRARLPRVIDLLSARSFDWQLTVDHLALGYDTSEQQGSHSRFDFGKRTT